MWWFVFVETKGYFVYCSFDAIECLWTSIFFHVSAIWLLNTDLLTFLYKNVFISKEGFPENKCFIFFFFLHVFMKSIAYLFASLDEGLGFMSWSHVVLCCVCRASLSSSQSLWGADGKGGGAPLSLSTRHCKIRPSSPLWYQLSPLEIWFSYQQDHRPRYFCLYACETQTTTLHEWHFCH